MEIHKTARCRMNRTRKLFMSLLAVVVLGLAATAQAQDTPPPAPPPPAASSTSSGGSISLGGGAGVGVGATVALTTLAFPVGLFVYDAGIFHIEGLFGLTSQPNPGTDRTTEWIFGAGGWYHLHRGASSDFSLGGVIAIDYLSAPGGSATLTALEPGIQVRTFLTPNVAVHARGGLSILLGDTAPGGGANFYLGGQPVLFWGFSYFFR